MHAQRRSLAGIEQLLIIASADGRLFDFRWTQRQFRSAYRSVETRLYTDWLIEIRSVASCEVSRQPVITLRARSTSPCSANKDVRWPSRVMTALRASLDCCCGGVLRSLTRQYGPVFPRALASCGQACLRCVILAADFTAPLFSASKVAHQWFIIPYIFIHHKW